jgi:hypothetical protein
VAEQDGGTPARMSVLRWIELFGAVAVMVAGAAWMFLPTAGPRVAATEAAANITSEGHDHGAFPRGYVGPALPPPLELSSPEPAPTGPPPATQHLAAMRTYAGPKNVRGLPYGGKPNRTLAMACASGQGKDLYREVRYHLRKHYGVLTAQLVNVGSNDSIRIHVLGADGTIYKADLRPDKITPIKLDLVKSEYLRIRLFCTSPDSRAEFRDAVVAR